MPTPLLRRCIAEAIGTFALVFIGCGAVVTNTVTAGDGGSGAVGLVGVALAFGLVVMAMVYALGDVSGAHINPAVTVGLLLHKKFPPREVPGYIAAQILGAIAAAALLRVLFRDVADLGVTNPNPAFSILWWQAALLEVVLTFFLVFAVLRVTAGSQAGGLLAGVAIGGVVAMDILVGGPICGGSMNPARSIGPAILSNDLTHLWIYLIAPLAGAAIAVLCFNLTRADDPS